MSIETQNPAVQPAPGSSGEVLTLAEAAAYLRVPEAGILTAVAQQQLPGRKILDQWRFLKSALDDWLRRPPSQGENLRRLIGAWKDDPYLDEMLEQIYRERGRLATAEDNP